MKKIHYLSYGSNILWPRLAAYVLGGRVPGTDIVERGSRDHTEIDLKRSYLVRVPGLLYTAGHSARWDETGVAFVDLADGEHEIIMRSYPLTPQQFSDVVDQELSAPMGDGADQKISAHKLVHGDIDQMVNQVVEQSAIQVSPGPYGTVFHLGNIDDEPLLTFSAPFRADEVAHNAPNAAYLEHISSGLVSAGVGERAAKAYVNVRPGSKLGLPIPAHVATNRGPELGRPGASASPTPGPSYQAGSDHAAAAALPRRLAQIARGIPSVRQFAAIYPTLHPGWSDDGVLHNPAGGLYVCRGDSGRSRSLERS